MIKSTVWGRHPKYTHMWVSIDGDSYNEDLGKLIYVSDRYCMSGYPAVKAVPGGNPGYKSIHRMMAETFIGTASSREVVRHLDDNSKNNTFENLMFGSKMDNAVDAGLNGKMYINPITLYHYSGCIVTCPTLQAAARYLDIDPASIHHAINHKGRLLKKSYTARRTTNESD